MLKENILKTTTFIGAMDQNFDTANFVWKWVKFYAGCAFTENGSNKSFNSLANYYI